MKNMLASGTPRLYFKAPTACIFVSWICSAWPILSSLSLGFAMFLTINVKPLLIQYWGGNVQVISLITKKSRFRMMPQRKIPHTGDKASLDRCG